MHPHHFIVFYDLESRSFGLEKEGAHPHMSLHRRIGDGEEADQISDTPVGDVTFLTIDHPLVTLQLGSDLPLDFRI